MKKILLIILALAFLPVLAQDGSLDTSFGDEGIVITDIDNSIDMGMAVAQQVDGKLIVAGVTSSNNGNTYYPYLLKYMTDGNLDTTFGVDGKLIADYAEGYGESMYLFTDEQQKIIVAGIYIEGQNYNFKVARYDSSGVLDSSFGIDGVLTVPSGYQSKMVRLSDGSFIFVKFENNNDMSLIHYLENGTLDDNFGVGGTATSALAEDFFRINEVKVDLEGNILVLGVRDIPLAVDILLIKFQPHGYLDTSFGNNGIVTKTIETTTYSNISAASFDFTNDGKVVVAGSAGGCVDEFQPVMQPFFLKYEVNGLPDTSFGDNGIKLLPISAFRISQLMIQENQRMVVTGPSLDCFEGSYYTIKRYYSGGTLDSSFGGGAIMELDYNKSIMQEDGKIVSVGSTFWFTNSEDIVLVRHFNDPLSVPQFENQKVAVYPNPSEGIFFIENSASLEKEFYQISDITGKVISKGELNGKQTEIDLSYVQSGMYFLKTEKGVFRLLKN